MTRIVADVALLTERRYTASVAPSGDWYLGNVLLEDRLLTEALARIGFSSVRVDWSRADVDWGGFRCAVFRSTWDYFDRLSDFLTWLDRVGEQIPLCNSMRLVRWNLDKHYLADLESAGIPIVPSRYLERGSGMTLRDALRATGWVEAVIKPCVSGTARHTYRLNPQNVQQLESIIGELLASESLILQPFQREILAQGEDSLIVLGGQFTHAVRKTPKPGDFRVQDDHGGTVQSCRPTSSQIELAERAIDACPSRPAYGRVDMVRDNEGNWAVMEVELIEPELFLRHNPSAAAVLAESIVMVLGDNLVRR